MTKIVEIFLREQGVDFKIYNEVSQKIFKF